MSDAEARGRELFENGFFCAEAVCKAIAERRGMDNALIPGIATGFCGGMARSGGPCGAVTGAVLALGLVHGRDDPAQSVRQTYDAVREMMATFDDQNLASKCADFTGAAAAMVDEKLQEKTAGMANTTKAR
jgi:C_GCAxxG_C_C family probable redox protein